MSENVDTFTVEDGMIVAHLPGSNGGVYIDTEYLEKGLPLKGFAVQVNHTFVKDLRRTASLYQVKDTGEEVAENNEWFTEYIIAKGDTITIKVNDKVITQWTPPHDWAGAKSSRPPHRRRRHRAARA